MSGWIDGTITNGLNNKTVSWELRTFDEPSRMHGLDGGRISNLYMEQDGECVFNYNRGLDLEAKTPETTMALALLLKAYN